VQGEFLKMLFGVLAQRFRVFGKPIEFKVSTVDLVIRSACYLHNWLRMTSSNYIRMGCEDLATGTFPEGHWRAERNLGLAPVRNIASSNYTTSARSVCRLFLWRRIAAVATQSCRNRLEWHYKCNMRKYWTILCNRKDVHDMLDLFIYITFYY
jgi:hypothetical protein